MRHYCSLRAQTVVFAAAQRSWVRDGEDAGGGFRLRYGHTQDVHAPVG
jgi:hypothetical protein